MSNIKSLFKKFFKDKNNREVSGNVLFTLVIKGFAMLISLLTVPAYVKYFNAPVYNYSGPDAPGEIVYGAWLTIAAVFTWINTFDFGIGNGLRNHLVKSIADKDDEASKKYISSAYVSIGLLSVVFLAVGITASQFLNWNSLLGVPEEIISAAVLKRFVEIIFCGVVIHFFFLLVSSIFYAIQRTFWPNLLTLITHIIILAFIKFAAFESVETAVTALSFVYILAFNIPLLIATLVLFATGLRRVRPSFKYFGRDTAKSILSLGGLFFAIQLSLIALNSSNEIYINSFFSASDVTQYNYYHKLFYIITVFVSLLGQPVWSAITKAFCEKRYKWIKGLWKILAGIALICTVGCVLLALLYQPIADIWLGKGKLQVELLPVSLFAVMTIQMTVINLSNCFSNGLGKIKCQAICVVIGAVLKLPLSWLFSKYIGSWPAIILATIVAAIPLLIIQPIYIFRYISKLDAESNEE